MEQKNRFSTLLENIVSIAEVKHYSLAQDLQFDVSYISKWISGRVLPSEKTAEDILSRMSQSLVRHASPGGFRQLCQDYQVTAQEELWQAIYENLIAEYCYVRELQQNSGRIIAPNVSYFPELSMKHFLSKMHHPVLRRVKSLNIMAAIDLFSISYEYRMQIVSLGRDPRAATYVYPDVHFSLLVNLHSAESDIIRNTLFLTNLLTNLSQIDFRLYRGQFAYGKAMFVVKHDFAISGMLIGSDSFASVAVCEGNENSTPLYNSIQSLCTREALLFLKVDMAEAITQSMDYIRSLLAPHCTWMLGHMTEHFLPDDLFRDLIGQSSLIAQGCTPNQLLHIHHVTKGMILNGSLQLLVSESAISRFVISGEVDFFNEKLTLTVAQRTRALEYFLELSNTAGDAQVKIIQSPLISDFACNSSPSIFMSETLSFLRLETTNQPNNLVLKINGSEIQSLYQHFLRQVWATEDPVGSSQEALVWFVQHQLQGLQLLQDCEKDV